LVSTTRANSKSAALQTSGFEAGELLSALPIGTRKDPDGILSRIIKPPKWIIYRGMIDTRLDVSAKDKKSQHILLQRFEHALK
jgi:hypothetical protein